MNRILLFGLGLSASAALACVGTAPCTPVAPGDRLNVPANAPAFAGVARVTLPQADGGVREFQPLDAGSGGLFFVPPTLVRGDLLTLVGTDVCGASMPPLAQVSVLEPAPFPTDLGTVELSEATGYQRPQGTAADCSPVSQIPAVKRSVSVRFPVEVLPWLTVGRVRVNGSEPSFGHLARSATPGQATLVGEVTNDCNLSDQTFMAPLAVEFEIAGRREVLRVESTIEFDCRRAPDAPVRGCSTSASGAALFLLGAWLTRRRLSGRAQPR